MDAVGYNHAMPALQALNAIAPYDGKKDPDAWLSSIQAIADLYGWTEELCLKIARVRLTGPAWNWAQARQFPSWAAFQQQLDSRYGETKESAIARLECCRQYATESVKDFADRYLYNAEKAGRVEDEALIYNFIQRLQPGLKLEVARQRCHSIEEIVTFCNFWNGLLLGAEENVDPTGSAGFGPFSRPQAFAGPPRRPEFKPSNQGRRPPPYRPPPLRDNTNRGPGGAPRNDYRPPFKHNNFSPAPAAVADSAIDELTQKFKKLELNLHHQMQDKDREIRTLRYALKQQREQAADSGQMNFMSPLDGPETLDSDGDDDDYDLDHELLTSLFVKRSADGEPQYTRTPAKRTALNPPGQVRPPEPNPQEAAEATRRIPRQRQPYRAAPYPAAQDRPNPAATAAPRAGPNPSQVGRPLDAAQLVDDKAKRMAADICRSIKFDGMQEATLPPQAVLTTLAGHLAGDQPLISLGQDMARRVTTMLQGMRRQHVTPAHAFHLAASPVRAPLPGTQRLYARQPAQALPKISTCKVVAGVNGKDVTSVLDTGATGTAVTLDLLRRLNLDSLIDSSATKYLNADGRVSAGMGRVPNLVLSLGDFSTLISPTVTNALNYDMLIGNDVLHRARAVIDYNRGKMIIQVDPTLSQEIDISLSAPDDSTCFALEAINCSEANASSNSGPEAAHMMLDTHLAVKLTPSCAAATDESPTDQDMTDSESLSGLCAPALNVDLSSETEEPDVGPPSAAAATTGQQSYLQQPTAEHTADAPQYLISTTAETTEPLGPLSAPEHTVSKDTSLEGFTQAAHMMTEPDAARFDAALDILGARYTAAPGMPDLLCIELTSKFASLLSLHNDRVSSATAVQPEAVGTSLAYTATMPLLPQDNADKCPEAVTIFDPGGCLPFAPWRAVCSPQPL